MSITISARDIMAYSKDQLWSLPEGEMTVVFDDGPLITNQRKTIFSSYLWDIHREYSKTPLLKRHHLQDDRLSGKKYLDILSNIYKDWYQTYGGEGREYVWRRLYQISNTVYNDFIQALDAYVVSLNILDFIEVMDNPKVKESIDNLRPNQKSIDDQYDVLNDVLMNDSTLNDNPIALAARSKLVDMKQINQCLGARGFTTEIDSTIFKEPIAVGFAKGMRTMYDSMIESRSASKALSYAKDPLQLCEYFNRKLQLLGQSVVRLHPGDCGSTHTMPWLVEASELKMMAGIHYLEKGELRTIDHTDHTLVGKTLQLRTPFSCIHPDGQGICETCHGDMALSIPYGTVPGHEAAISIGEKTSQLVLSVKHVEGSSKVDDIDLGEIYSQYLIPGSEDNTLRFNKDLKGSSIKMVISPIYLKSLPDIENLNNLDDIKINTISEIKEATLIIGEDDHQHEMVVPTSMGARWGSLTTEALYYIKDHPVEITDNGDYMIDFTNWDIRGSLFELPLKHINMLDFQDQVEQVILSTDRKIGLICYDDRVEAIKSLLSLINSKLKINLSHIMTICYAAAAKNPKGGDYRLPRGGESFTFCNYNNLMQGRSLGAAMAYERQERPLFKPEAYTVKNRPAHPIDDLLMGGLDR